MTITSLDIPEALINLDHAIHRNELKPAGLSMAQVRSAERAGHIAQFRGDYFGPPEIAQADHRTQLIAAIGAHLRATPGLVVGGRTAAQLHGWTDAKPRPVPSYYSPRDHDVIEFRDYREQPKAFTRKAVHNVVDGRPRTITIVDGVEVTTIARTLVDLINDRRHVWSRVDKLESFVILGDRLLREGVTTAADLEAEVALLPAGSRAGVLDGVRQLDGRAQNEVQSRSRLALARFGLPKPELCVDVYDDDGAVIATPPFVWPEYRVVGFSEEVDAFCDFERRFDECDDRNCHEWHSSDHHPYESDHPRRCEERESFDARLTAAGYRVFRWTDARVDRHPCNPCNLRRALKTPLPELIEDPFSW